MHIKPLYKPLIFLYALLPVISGCSVTKFTIVDEDLRQVKTVAVIYEKGESDRPENLISECSQSFKGFLVESGLEIVELNEKEGVVKAIDSGDFRLTGNSGVDAYFIYEITDYREDKRIGFRKKRTDGFMMSFSGAAGKRKRSDSDEEIIEIKTFHFRIKTRLIQNSSGKTLLSAENSMVKATDELGVYDSMDSFKRYILTNLGKEISQTITLSRK